MQRTLFQAQYIFKHGVYIGPRDPRRRPAFPGKFMIAEDINIDAHRIEENAGFCIVGDDLTVLINDAFNHIVAHEADNEG